ncbi:MAG TPA: cobalamin biosynthesis protein, partial [Propionibacteriaceae bacterium]|nr:cobalamin biosynthesis protein [Propionibacteriaceae bacterium]
AAPWVGGSPTMVLRVVRRDAGQHPSPNAGVVEAAFAGALGIRLGGRNVYLGQVEERGVLGEGPAAGADDIPRASRLAAAVSLTALALAMLIRSGRR